MEYFLTRRLIAALQIFLDSKWLESEELSKQYPSVTQEIEMIQKLTAFLMFLIALTSTFSFGAEEPVSHCESSSATHSLSENPKSIFLSAHHDFDSGNTHHEHPGSCHECHLGHCQYLIVAISSIFPRPQGSLRCEWPDSSEWSVQIPSLDRPPRA